MSRPRGCNWYVCDPNKTEAAWDVSGYFPRIKDAKAFALAATAKYGVEFFIGNRRNRYHGRSPKPHGYMKRYWYTRVEEKP